MLELYPNFPQEYALLHDSGYLNSIDCHFAEYMYEQSNEKSTAFYLAILLLSKSINDSSICFDLEHPVFPRDTENETEDIKILFDSIFKAESLQAMKTALEKSSSVGKEGDYQALLLWQNKLYLQKYAFYEELLSRKLCCLAQNSMEVNTALLKQSLDRLFSQESSNEADMQKLAAFNAVFSRLSIISGGPGTGKTTTVVKILLLLIQQYLQANKQPNICLLAPTGKAAAHLSQSLQASLDFIRRKNPEQAQWLRQYEEHLPATGSTIHKILGLKPRHNEYRYDNENPLGYKILVVDESSMIDVALMAKFLNAVREDAHVILLGDKNQLASVQAGSVLGDICGTTNRPSLTVLQRYLTLYPDDTAMTELFHDVKSENANQNKLADNIVVLQKSHRFTQDSGIGEAAAAVNCQNTKRLLEVLTSSQYPDVSLIQACKHEDGREKQMLELLNDTSRLISYKNYFASSSLEQAFATLKQFRILCAVRKGPAGVETLNKQVETLFGVDKQKGFYHLMPVLVTKNDYQLNLYNGDVGIAFQKDSVIKVYFDMSTDSQMHYRSFYPAQLSSCETVYAMTIHKSQGSEFNDVLLVLPSVQTELLSKELLYTGLTRAKNRVVIVSSQEILENAVQHRIQRMSGLQTRLHNNTD